MPWPFLGLDVVEIRSFQVSAVRMRGPERRPVKRLLSSGQASALRCRHFPMNRRRHSRRHPVHPGLIRRLLARASVSRSPARRSRPVIEPRTRRSRYAHARLSLEARTRLHASLHTDLASIRECGFVLRAATELVCALTSFRARLARGGYHRVKWLPAAFPDTTNMTPSG